MMTMIIIMMIIIIFIIFVIAVICSLYEQKQKNMAARCMIKILCNRYMHYCY
jgi:hypothetical protein